MSEENKKPVVSNRDRLLSVSVFPHTEQDEKGNTRTTYGACLQRAYQKPEQKGTKEYERQQINLFPDELLRVAALCMRSYNDIVLYAQINRSQSTGNLPAQSMDVEEAAPMPEDSIPF